MGRRLHLRGVLSSHMQNLRNPRPDSLLTALQAPIEESTAEEALCLTHADTDAPFEDVCEQSGQGALQR